mgnify:CR=1 FL=1
MAGFLSGISGLVAAPNVAMHGTLPGQAAKKLFGKDTGVFKNLQARRKAKKGIQAMKPMYEG